MNYHRAIGMFLATLIFCGSALLSARGQGNQLVYLIQDGKMVYDTVNQVTWLSDFNLPHTERFTVALCDPLVTQPADLPCVNRSGSMNYPSALAWVQAMNDANYLGHQDWQLPTTPTKDHSCDEKGPLKNNFGFGCDRDALGYLYYRALGLMAPATAVPIPSEKVGPFINLQPNLYWSKTAGDATTGGKAVFSFASGAQGGSTRSDYLFAWPMIQGQISGAGTPINMKLQVSEDGMTVYDPVTNVTWLTDANLAASVYIELGLPLCEKPGTPQFCVAADGAMNYASAEQLIVLMNAFNKNAGYLGHTGWTLPTVNPNCPTFNCDGVKNPMGELYYNQLGFHEGTPVVLAPDIAVGPFHNMQPSQYWSCLADTIQEPCETAGPGVAGMGAEWGFSFGNGFLGTTGLPADHFVTAYFVGCALHDQAKCLKP